MKFKTFYVVAVVLSAGILWAADAFTGTWKLVPEKSKFAQGKEAKSITAVATEKGTDMHVAISGVAKDGTPIAVEWTEPAKGGSVRYTKGGPPEGTTVVTKRVNANTIESTSTMNGKQVGTTKAVVSKDGKMLTVTMKGLDEKGKMAETVEVYERQ